MSLRDALRKVGAVESAPANSKSFAGPVVAVPVPDPDAPPPPDWAVDWAAALAEVDPRRDWAALLDRCMDGTGRGRESFHGAVNRALDTLPAARANALSPRLADWTRKGLPTWEGMAESVLDAIRGGYGVAKLAEVAAAPTPPQPEENEPSTDYIDRVLAWAAERTRGQIRSAFGGDDNPERWAYSQLDAVKKAREERALKARVAFVFNLLRAETPVREVRAAAFETPQTLHQLEASPEWAAAVAKAAQREGAALLAELDAGADPAAVAARVNDDVVHPCRKAFLSAIGRHPAVWAAGLDCIAGDAPPQGWAALPLATVWRIRGLVGAMAELTRRLGGVGGVARIGDDAVIVLPDGTATAIADLPSCNRVGFEPAPEGWVELGGRRRWDTGPVWCGPEIHAALTRARSRAGGTCDFSRVADLYGRHPEKNFPRLSAAAWKTYVTVGIADAIGSALDDLVAVKGLCPGRLTPDMWRLDATPRRTEQGGLYIDACPGDRTALFCVAGGTSSQGRHGKAGSMRTVAEGSSALCVQATGASGGGGQHRSIVIAAIQEGRPLLLDTGVGYRLTRDGVEEVPGLADGRPGTPKRI